MLRSERFMIFFYYSEMFRLEKEKQSKTKLKQRKRAWNHKNEL